MCYRVNSDNSGRATGVSYYGPDGSDNTIEAEIVILAPFIYDNTRLLLLSKTDKFPNGLANSSGQLGKHIMAHIDARMCSSASTTATSTSTWGRARRSTRSTTSTPTISTTADLGFIRGVADLDRHRPTSKAARSPAPRHAPAARRAALGRRLSRLPRASTTRATPRWSAQTENLPYAGPDHRSRSQRARRLGPAGAAHDLRLAAAERTRARRVHAEEDARRSAARWARRMVWQHAAQPAARPARHHEGGTRMGSDPKTSVVNNYGQSWDIPNLFVIGSSTFPSHERLQPDADDPGARLHERRRDREQVQEEPGRRCCSFSDNHPNSELSPSSGIWESASQEDQLAQTAQVQWGIGSHGNGKNRCRHRRRRRGRRHHGGRARQGRHESDRARARPASHDRDFAPQDELRYFQRQDLRPEPEAPARDLAAERRTRARRRCRRHELRQPGRRRHRPLRRGVVALARGRFPRPLAHDRALRRRRRSRRAPRSPTGR